MSKQNEIMELAKQELPQLKAILALNTSKDTDVETLALQELQYLEQISLTNSAISEVEPITALMAIKSVLKKNLTLDPDAGLVYVKTRNYKAGKDQQGNDIWKKALEIQETANGKISVARQCGTILDVERPVIVKDDAGKVLSVKFKYLVPSYNEQGQKSARWKEIEFDESDFDRWRWYSHKENRRTYDNAKPQYRGNKPVPDDEKMNYANPLYTSFKGGIDPEFARAKSIVHGLKKLGTNQNEKRAMQIINPIQKIVVNEVADVAAVDDTYIPHEDVTSVSATTHEEMEIPVL